MSSMMDYDGSWNDYVLRQLQTSKRIYLVTFVLTIGLLLTTGSKSSFLTLLLYALLPIGLWKPEYLIPSFFVSSLSSVYFEATAGVGFARLLALAIIAGVVSRIVASKEPLRTKWFFHCMLVLYATFMSFSLAHSYGINTLSTMALNIVILITMTNLSLSEEELGNIFRAILLAVLISSVYFTVEFITNAHYISNGRLTIDDAVNANRFAMMIAQMVAFFFAYMRFSKKNYVKAICLLGGAVDMYLLLMSGSRSALIGVTLGFISTVLISMYVHTRKIKGLFSTVLICTIIGYIFYTVIQLNPVLFKRMNVNEVVSSGGTHRWPRIVAELQYVIPAHPFFGVGINAESEEIALTQYVDLPGSSHNFIISPLTQVGIVGFIIYMSLYWRIIKETVSHMRFRGILIIPLMLILTAIFNGVGEVIYSGRIFWNALSLAALSLAVYTEEGTTQWETHIKNWNEQISERDEYLSG